jgi:hypothetical protein
VSDNKNTSFFLAERANTLFVDNVTEHWQAYSEFCRMQHWYAGWAINYNAAVNGLGYREYDYVILGEKLGDDEDPMMFVKYIIDNKVKIKNIVIAMNNKELIEKMMKLFKDANYHVLLFSDVV